MRCVEQLGIEVAGVVSLAREGREKCGEGGCAQYFSNSRICSPLGLELRYADPIQWGKQIQVLKGLEVENSKVYLDEVRIVYLQVGAGIPSLAREAGLVAVQP